MTDKPAPKPAKKGKDKTAKKPTGPKLVAKDITPGIGHNSGEKVPGMIAIVDELMALGLRKKEIGKAERDLRNKAKSEFGVLSGPLAHEMRLRKMDSDVRVQFESSHKDLKVMLGYQPELDFVGAQPTQASAKAQPPEAELAAAGEGKRFTVEEDVEEAAGEPEAEDGDEAPAQEPRRIQREG